MTASNHRPGWDQYFLDDARHVSTRSTCDRLHCGCVLVRDNHRVVSGYNGALKGEPHCSGPGGVGHYMVDNHCVRAAHAERNAISFAANQGISTAGTTAYITGFPCWLCFQALVAAGIVAVVYSDDYRIDPFVIEVAQRVGITIHKGPRDVPKKEG